MAFSDLRFLVVEDHEFQSRMLDQLLRAQGAAAVYTAADGRAALQVLRTPEQPVDIIISDLDMPGMDGLEFVRALSEIGDRSSLILASAVDDGILASVVHVAHAYKVNLLGVVGKPLTAAKLSPLVQLHRESAEPDGDDSNISLDQIVAAWTRDEFEAWFVPKVSLADRRVTGMHVVPAWRHPERGVLLAPQFMPSVRARGLNDDFLWMLLQKALAHHREWAADQSLQLSFDLSVQSLASGNLVERLQQLAQQESVEPRRVLLSVSEATLCTDSARTLENLARLRMMGFKLGLGDFGSGQMAVERLATVAFTEVKVGSSYVKGVGKDPALRAGLAVGIELAQQLRARAAAEGLESLGDWALLQEWGCHVAQGPFISGPISSQAVPGWLRQWTGKQ